MLGEGQNSAHLIKELCSSFKFQYTCLEKSKPESVLRERKCLSLRAPPREDPPGQFKGKAHTQPHPVEDECLGAVFRMLSLLYLLHVSKDENENDPSDGCLVCRCDSHSQWEFWVTAALSEESGGKTIGRRGNKYQYVKIQF